MNQTNGKTVGRAGAGFLPKLASTFLVATLMASTAAIMPQAAMAAETGGSTIAAGANGSMAVTSDGSLWAWGQNTHGQLADGTKTDSATPKQVSGKYARVSDQGTHVVALDASGTASTWGQGSDGRLGSGKTADATAPQKINGRTFARVAAGETHTLALDPQGHLWAWGDNSYGQLGNGTTKDATAPVEITPNATYTSIAVGAYHSLAIDSQGHLWAWGYDQEGELGDNGSTAVSRPKMIGNGTYAEVHANGYASFALDKSGNLYGWGYNLDGMIGDGTTTDIKTPKRIGSTTFKTVSVGYFHTLALDSQGHLWAWGRNPTGQLGDGTVQNSTTPKEITPNTTYTQIAAGANHSLAVDSANNLWAWGYGKDGELGYTISQSTCPTAKSVEGSGLDTCPVPTRILSGKTIMAVDTTPTSTDHTVTFDTAGGSTVANQTVKNGSKATRPADPTRNGFTFAGWTLNGKTYDFTQPVTGDITLVAQWKANASTGGTTLACRASGSGATGPKAGNFCWIDFSGVDLNDSKWSAGAPVTVTLPGAKMTATMKVSTNTAAKDHWKNYKPYTDAGYDKLTDAQRKILLNGGMTNWSATWLALWKAYALPNDMELPAFDTYNVAPQTSNGEATITLSGISMAADRGYTLNNDWHLAFGDAEVMSGFVDSATGKQTQYEQTTVTSDKPIARLGYALGLGDDSTYGVANTMSGNTLTIAGGKTANADKYGNTDANDAVVATATAPGTFKVDFSQQGGASGRSAIAIGLQLPWRTQMGLGYNANGGTGSMPGKSADEGTKVTVDENKFTRPGYTFTGWNTKADGSGDSYAPGAQITLNSAVTLYAQWKPAGVNGLPGTGGMLSWLPMILGGGLAAVMAGVAFCRVYARRHEENL